MNASDILYEQDIEYQLSLAMDIEKEKMQERKRKEEEEKQLQEEKEAAEIEEQLRQDEQNRLSPKSLRLQRLKYFTSEIPACGASNNIHQLHTKKQKCSAVTKSGKCCLKFRSKDSDFCHIHKSK